MSSFLQTSHFFSFSIKLENLSHIFKDDDDSETSAHLKASIANKLKNPKPVLEVVSPDTGPRQVMWITKGKEHTCLFKKYDQSDFTKFFLLKISTSAELRL